LAPPLVHGAALVTALALELLDGNSSSAATHGWVGIWALGSCGKSTSYLDFGTFPKDIPCTNGASRRQSKTFPRYTQMANSTILASAILWDSAMGVLSADGWDSAMGVLSADRWGGLLADGLASQLDRKLVRTWRPWQRVLGLVLGGQFHQEQNSTKPDQRSMF
jgi:hypothetical protein